MHESGPFILPAIRDFVSEKWKPWIMIAIVIVFQLSGGIYLASVAEMVGSLALLHEDIMMAGYASLVGMSLTFAIMFRLKFRFNSKVSLLTCCIVLIVCNLICMHTSSVPLLYHHPLYIIRMCIWRTLRLVRIHLHKSSNRRWIGGSDS